MIHLSEALIAANQAGNTGGAFSALNSTLDLQSLTIVANTSPLATLNFGYQAIGMLGESLVAFNAGSGLQRTNSATVTLNCCDLYGHPGGDFVNFPEDPIGVDGNISLDPRFCDLDAGDYSLEIASPCLPEHNDCGSLMGCFAVGCTYPSIVIAGHVIDGDGQPLVGVEITGAGGPPVLTDASGSYAVDVVDGWSGTLVPSLLGYAFTPSSRVYTGVVVDQIDQDFVASHDTGLEVPLDYPTIAAALAVAAPGDTVFVAPGTYAGTGNRNLLLPPFDVVVLGSGGSEVTTLDCGNYYRAFTVNQGQTPATLIQGFTILDGMPSSASGGGIYSAGASPTLRDLRFVHCRAGGVGGAGGAIYMQGAAGALLEDIVIVDGYAYDGGGAGIALRQSSVAIDGLLVGGNRSAVLACGLDAQNSQLSLMNATFVDNACTGVGAVIALAGGSATLSRCLVAFNAGDGGISGSEDALLSINCSNLWQNQGGNYTGEFGDLTGQGGNLAADPLFSDLSAGDWHLHADSPCLPTGNTCGVLIGALGEGGTGVLHRIAGTVRDAASQGLPGVLLEGLAVLVETQADGSYGVWLPEGWSGTLTPGAAHLRFTPAARSYDELASDHTAEDYLASNPTRFQFPTDFADLQEAVDFCDDGDTLIVLPGTYNLPTDEYGIPGLDLGNKAICMQSLSGPQVTVLQHGSIGLLMQANDDLTIRGLTIADCDVAVSCYGLGAPRFEDVIIEDSGALPDALYALDSAAFSCWGSSPQLVNVLFRNNDGRQEGELTQGGAVYCSGNAAPQFFGCRFENNIGVMGGAIYLQDASPIFINSQFIGNQAAPLYTYNERWTWDAYGGAIYCEGGAPSFIYCSFVDNEACMLDDPGDVSGGAVYLAGSAAPSFLNCSFSGNGAIAAGHTALGGGIYLEAGAAPVLANCILAFGTGGGGFYSPNDTLALAMSCSDVFGNEGGDFLGLPDPTGSQGNISLDPHFCDREAGDLQLAANSPCLPANNACGVQMGPFGQGCAATALPDADVPRALSLSQNSPNPFNPSTTIRFGLPRPATVDLCVHDALGRRVATLIAGERLPAGYHEPRWLGKDAAGRALASGVYFLRLEVEGRRLTRKMLLLK
ncbi:hypothetical protein FJ251_01550 [bacterium]|nr:hypothetical protein [bacterium]